MRVITVRDRILGVSKAWDTQYADTEDTEKIRIGQFLSDLDLTVATASQIKKIIGNDSWTDLQCDECGKRGLDRAVMVGQEPDYESATAYLCQDCASEAASLVCADKNAKPNR